MYSPESVDVTSKPPTDLGGVIRGLETISIIIGLTFLGRILTRDGRDVNCYYSRFKVQGSRFPRKKSIDSPFRRKYHMPLITPGIV
jgi:hypothetical protein